MREGAKWNKREIEKDRYERKKKKGAGPPTSRTGPRDAFTYRTCNNLEKVLTMVARLILAAKKKEKFKHQLER